MTEIRHVGDTSIRGTFDSFSSQTETIGNRSGKNKERGQLVVEDYAAAVEFFTRSVDGEDYADIWNQFSQAGMPVVNELWMDGEGKVYMPDLTSDGSGLYGKALEQAVAEVSPKAVDRVFLRVWERQKEEITQAANNLASYATEQGLLLPLDDPFDLHVYPDGSWELLCLDLEYGGTLNDLIQRKNRMTTNVARFPLSERFGNRTVDQLSQQEKEELILQINQRVTKTALVILDSLARKMQT